MATQAGPNLESGNVNEYTAEAAIEAYRAVKYGTAEGEVVACSAITDIAIGVSLNKVALGGRVQVQTGGVALVTVSAGVARGAQLMPTAAGAGKGMTAAGASARSFAIAENTTANDAEVAVVRLCCPNLNGPANS